MGISTVTAARILRGQLKGQLGEENLLEFEKFPHVGLSKVKKYSKSKMKICSFFLFLDNTTELVRRDQRLQEKQVLFRV